MSYGRILVVDEEAHIRKLVRPYLQREKYVVRCCGTAEEALDEARRHPPDLIVLGLRSPGLDGLHICQALRATSNLPIILLIARAEGWDEARGRDGMDDFHCGADDWLIKPFSPSELAARVKAVLRRVRLANVGAAVVERVAEPVETAGVRVDPISHEVKVRGHTVGLTRTEFRLIEMLVREPGRTFTRAQCISRAFKVGFDGLDRNVDVHMMNLRKKLGIDPSPICTVRAVGYKLRTV